MKKRNLTQKIKLRHKKKVERTIIICSIFAILIALYCLACFELDSKVIWKNVTANGISLKGMTKKEATDALAKNLETITFQKMLIKSTSWDTVAFYCAALTGYYQRHFMARKKRSRYILFQNQPKR